MIGTIIVGAGPGGLCAAKTILQCDPHAELTIYEAQASVGGVWSKEKIYPTLKTNHMFGGVDFSDFPMAEGNGAEKGKHIPGTAVHKYFCDYTRQWNLQEKIVFNTRVLEVAKLSGTEGWELKIESQGRQQIQQCRKLIIAIGMNNAPHVPQHPGSADFNAPILHSSQLGVTSTELFADKTVKTVAVLGGAKSAYDAAYLAALEGRQVEWIIRKSGRGPAWIFPLLMKLGPFMLQRDWLPGTRFVSWFSPCIWNDGYAWIRDWIHGTAIGRFIVQKFWAQMHADTVVDCAYASHEKLKVLEPETSPYWYGTVAGAYYYEPGIYDFIKNGQIRIHREDVAHLSERTIHLANGDALRVDALINATGFTSKPTIQFNPPSLHSSLGVPSTSLSKEQEDFWMRLDTKSDRAVGDKFPSLLAGPLKSPQSDTVLRYNPGSEVEVKHTPYRLYRSIASPGLTANGDRSLVFIGVMSNFANFTRMEVQCLWAYAYLNNKLDIDEKKTYEDASLISRYSKHRSPLGHGRFYPDHVFDQLPYTDVLIQDLGLSPWRKGSVFKEVFTTYTAPDYRGLVNEWIEKNRKV